jgi:hypothetical protein
MTCRRSMSQLATRSALAVLTWTALAASVPAQRTAQQALFTEASFDRWQAEGQREQVPWKVRLFPAKLSVHQRLEAGIEVHLPLKEISARQNHRIILLLQVIDHSSRRYRTGQILDVDNAGPNASTPKGDVPFSWGMFVLPGEYDVEVAFYDCQTGEHNLLRHKLSVAALTNDPLPAAWRGLPSVEFLSPATGGLDGLYRSDMEGRLNLPLRTARPLHLEVLADMTASEVFLGDTKDYEHYLAGVLPIVKVLSQVSPSKGSVSVAALDLDRQRVTVEQPNLQELNWSPLKDSLAAGNGPAVVSVRSLMERRHSPVFLRDELVRRMADAALAPAPAGDPLVVFVVVGGPLDSYSFPDLPAISLSSQPDCAVFYLQYDPGKTGPRGPTGGIKKLEKMLRPLHVRTFTVRSAESIRQALARVMEEISKL